MASKAPRLTYTAVTGFFQQDKPETCSGSGTATLPGLGLLDRPYDTDDAFDPQQEKRPWDRFAHYLDHLNKMGNGKVAYKLIYAARHGEGYHNVKEAEAGTAEWEASWAKLEGNGEITWADAHLTERGVRQAQDMKTFWADAATTLKMPLPRRHYASPLARCLETCEGAFSGLTLPADEAEVPPFKPVIKELLRERLGVHTCDRRRARTWIRDHYPGFAFEEGFAEQDDLWRPDIRETLDEHAQRVEAFLEDLFANDSEPIISLTVHSGTIQALYKLTQHPGVRVVPGAIVPVLIKAEAASPTAEERAGM